MDYLPTFVDGYLCCWCDAKVFTPDHKIKLFCKAAVDESEWIENGVKEESVAVCLDCHMKYHQLRITVESAFKSGGKNA